MSFLWWLDSNRPAALVADQSVPSRGPRGGRIIFSLVSDRFAVLLDGGFVTKKLSEKLGHYPAVSDVELECQRILSHSALTGCSLLRFYFYDAPPFQKTAINPLDGFRLDLGRSQLAREAQSLQEGLEMLPNFAVRRGQTIFHGWKLGRAAISSIQRSPRAPVVRDFVPDIKQKGVDLRIGLDLALLALRQLLSAIVVVTGDSDLVPAFKFARREGIRIFLDHMGHGVSRDLRAHVDMILRKNHTQSLPTPAYQSFLSASVNEMRRSILPVESKIRNSPERKLARLCA